MENKKDLISLNSKLYSSLSLEELEERMELGCWGYVCGCDDFTCSCQGANVTCTTQCAANCPSLCGANVPICSYNGGGE